MSRTKKDIMAGVDCISSKFIGNNTIEYYRENGERVIRLHDTDILTFQKNIITYNSGGWQTVTTKQRMNEHAPANIWQKNSIWYLFYMEKEVIYADNMTLNIKTGRITGAAVNLKKHLKLKKQIKIYVNGYMADLTALKISEPSNGDCWGCIADSKLGSDHLLSHFKEKYYVPTLAWNAANMFGISNVAKHCLSYWIGLHDQDGKAFEKIAKQQIKKALTRYLQRRLGLAT